MKTKQTKQKAIAFILLVAMANQLILPTLAIAGGPDQQEFNGYATGADMVNPLTGDFGYTIPLLDVPSPEGGFTLPLGYASGIKLDQDASWVGLGWSLNVGSINRSVIQFPDDYSGDNITTTFNREGSVNVPRGSGPGYGSTGRSSVVVPAVANTKAYGSLYLGNTADRSMNASLSAPLVYNGVVNPATFNNVYARGFDDIRNSGIAIASDVQTVTVSGNPSENIAPTSIANDSYTVLGPGISGSITPYRLDVGCLAMPLTGGQGSVAKYNIVDYQPASSTQKVHFRYTDAIANKYDHSIGTGYNSNGNGTVAQTIDANQCGLQNAVITTPNGPYYGVSLRDDFLWKPGNLIEPNRENLSNGHLGADKHIEWYSNEEISTGFAKNNGFINYLKTDNTRTGGGLEKRIGGFSITRADGFTYHYALPVYTFNAVTNITDIYNYIADNNKYAYSWLLTGITGSDFVDRGDIGVLDDQDQGYWVKFDYGRFSGYHGWSTPYIDGSPFSDRKFKVNADGSQTQSIGAMETYYLNTISTRTHTAMFVKSLRPDGKGSYGACALKLDNIYVLKNEDYKQLTGSGAGNLNLTYTSTANDNNTIGSSDTYSTIIDGNDIAANANGAAAFIKTHQLKRVSFTYDNSLCQGTTNAFNLPSPSGNPSPKQGKLTLLSIATYGMNDVKTQPDYLFEYNPAGNATYGADAYDGWGMLNPQGANNAGGHNASKYGTEWSLTKITTPIGGTLDIEYERDLYQNSNAPYVDYGATINAAAVTLPGSYSAATIGPTVILQTNILTAVYDNNLAKYVTTTATESSSPVTVTGVNGNTINLAASIKNIFGVVSQPATPPANYRMLAGQQLIKLVSPLLSKYGGNTRVSKITTTDELNNKQYVEYVYTQDGTKTGVTSGKTGVEPLYIRNDDPAADYNLYDYPNTPVMYGTVNVYTRNSTNPTQFLSRTEYTYVTPNAGMLTKQAFNLTGSGLNISSNMYVYGSYFNLQLTTSSIGAPLTAASYNSANQLMSKTAYTYATPADFSGLGKFTESTIVCELVPQNSWLYYLTYRTTKIYYPCILKSVTTTTPYTTQVVTNTKFDNLTGAVLESETSNAAGEKFLTVTKPAYASSLYHAGMGSKIYSSSWKNMLAQQGQSYTYHIKTDGTKQLMQSSVQTWNDTWNYREYDGNVSYVDVSRRAEIFRQHKNYSWKSLLNGESGTVATADFTDFNPDNVDTTHWQKTNEVVYYDHYSHQLAAKDINSNSSAVKYGYNNGYSIASAANAKYTELIYSGAEEVSPDTPLMFGGEVLYGISRQTTLYKHTGNYGCIVPNNGFGFTHRAAFANGGLVPGRTYHASVWIHKTNTATNIPVLYTSIRSSSNTSLGYDTFAHINDSNTKRAGDWYLISLDVTLPVSLPAGAAFLEIAVANINNVGDVYADDFRFHPVDAPMQSFVYNNRGLLQATLDKENFATVYEYDSTDRISATYREIKNDGLRKTSERKYNFARGN